jgi:hypothetical protein
MTSEALPSGATMFDSIGAIMTRLYVCVCLRAAASRWTVRVVGPQRTSRSTRGKGEGNTSDTAPVIAQMKATPVQDLFAKDGRLREDNLHIHDMFVFEVKKPSESKYPWDHYSLKATVKREQAFQPLTDSKCPLVKTR